MGRSSARNKCLSYSQENLMAVKTARQLDCVLCYLEKLGEIDERRVTGVTDGFVWLGADDLAEEGKFVWDDGTPLPQDSPLWRENEPSGLTGEHCVSLDVQEGSWGSPDMALRGRLNYKQRC
ncbi:C-type lectin mosGCTL-7-like [Babylonia areolata]|uniref:C-type lectin mosGCTL-7-like n=1 Tax=Babylonia areolata TaxID=304850 RepID=UPI003FD4C25A